MDSYTDMGTGTPDRQPASTVRYVAGNAGALLLGLVVAYFALAWTGAGDAATKSIKTVDFMTYYSAFRLILTGHGGALYDPHVLGHLQAQLTLPLHTPYGVIPYLYPGYFALLFAPLGYLPYGAAYLVWLALNCVLLTASLYLLERVAGLGKRGSLALRAAALCFLPVFMALGLGQASLMLLATFVAGWWALRSGRNVTAGAILGLAAIKPYYLLPFLVVFLVQRRWQGAGAMIGTGTALLLAPLPILGASSLLSWIRTMLTASAWQGSATAVFFDHVSVAHAVYAARWNHSMAGFLELLSSPHLAMVAFAAFSVAALALLALRAHVLSLDLSIGLAVLVALLISPHTLIYDLTLLLIPAAIAIGCRDRSRLPVIPLLTAGYITVTVGYRLVFAFPVQLSVIAMLGLATWYAMYPHVPSRDVRIIDYPDRVTTSHRKARSA